MEESQDYWTVVMTVTYLKTVILKLLALIANCVSVVIHVDDNVGINPLIHS